MWSTPPNRPPKLLQPRPACVFVLGVPSVAQKRSILYTQLSVRYIRHTTHLPSVPKIACIASCSDCNYFPPARECSESCDPRRHRSSNTKGGKRTAESGFDLKTPWVMRSRSRFPFESLVPLNNTNDHDTSRPRALEAEALLHMNRAHTTEYGACADICDHTLD